MQHTFLYISLPLFCTTTTWNFQKPFYGGNFVRVLFTFFFTPLIFSLHWWPLALSPPLQNFHVVLPTKKCLLCFLSLALNPCRPLSRWASLAYRPLSLFLCLSLALYSLGRAVGRCTVTWLPNFRRWVDYFIVLPMVLRWCASRARAPLKVYQSYIWLKDETNWSLQFCIKPSLTSSYRHSSLVQTFENQHL